MARFNRLVLVVICILSILLGGAAPSPIIGIWQNKVDPWILQTARSGDTEFLIFLSTQANLSGAKRLTSKSEKSEYVFQALTSTAQSTQKPVIDELDRLGVEHRSYWIANMLWVRSDLATIQLIAERYDVAHLYANPHILMDAPIGQVASTIRTNAVEWNIAKVNAPQVWAMGYTGQGVVIGGQDTGYAWDHPALKDHYRGWNGQSAVHDYNWFDATLAQSTLPVDPHGHGTHTMGTMVGDDGDQNQIGMAPGARWIGCRNMDANGAGSPETYIACYQWFIAPTRLDGSEPRPDLAPDVINNSWSCPPAEGCNTASLLIPVQNVVAAGIVTTHSAGNSGNACKSVSEPAAIYDESFTVGATDGNDDIASFSSRGPVTIDGSGRLKPDITAPGVSIRSSVPGGYSLMSGTSMSAPHVAGLVALLISAQPALRGQVDQIEAIIEHTAVPIPLSACDSSGVPNNTYGWGRMDALAAVQSLQQLQLGKTASAPVVEPGDLITYTISITNSAGTSPTTNVVLTDTIPAGSAFMSATQPFVFNGNTIRWDFPLLESHATRTVEMVVLVDITSTNVIINGDYAVQSDQVAMVHGQPVITLLENPQPLELSKTASSNMVEPGDFITYTLIITHGAGFDPTTNVILTDTLPAGSTFVSATPPYSNNDGTVRWDFPSMDPQDTRIVELVVRVNNPITGSIINDGYAVQSDQVPQVHGQPVTTQIIRYHSYLPLFYYP